jgi:riboflavin kinase/FMN adenylyltransferase
VRILRDLQPSGRPIALAIGNFDGVHLGHQAILERTVAVARARGLASAVMSFEPLPREFFAAASAPPRLSTLREKLALFAAHGIEVVHVCRFGARFAAQSPQEFSQRIAGSLGARWVHVGHDFRFGAKRAGDVPMLVQAGAELGFEVEVLPTLLSGDVRISSTAVREALAEGRLEAATALLGRPYSMVGRVVHGAKLGRALGFPTANIALGRERPALGGVFAVKCFGAATRGLEGVASLGFKPVVTKSGPATLETFLFDFSGDLYGRRLAIEFHRKLRDEADYGSLDALVAQIGRDVEHARDYFSGQAKR